MYFSGMAMPTSNKNEHPSASPMARNVRTGFFTRGPPLLTKIGVGFLEIKFLDPGIAVTDVMAFRLQLQSFRRVSDARTAIVTAIDAGARTAPDLVDLHVRVDFDAVEIHCDHRFFDALAVLKARGSEHDVVRVPFAEAIVGVVRRLRFVDHGAQTVLRFVAVEHLDFIAVLQIDAAVAAGFWNQELDMESK